jgi:hypothetical protein
MIKTTQIPLQLTIYKPSIKYLVKSKIGTGRMPIDNPVSWKSLAR